MTATARVLCSKNGPYFVTGGVALLHRAATPEGTALGEVLPRRDSYALCRCGRSRLQPFCDYKHMGAKFDGTETAERCEAPAEEPGVTGAPPAIEFCSDARQPSDGPLLLHGDIAVVSADGAVYETLTRRALCRCGASAAKPFCDGSHAGTDTLTPRRA